MCMRREGQSQTSPAVVPRPHLDYLDPKANAATQGLNKVSLLITRLGGREMKPADESREATKDKIGKEWSFSVLITSTTG